MEQKQTKFIYELIMNILVEYNNTIYFYQINLFNTLLYYFLVKALSPQYAFPNGDL